MNDSEAPNAETRRLHWPLLLLGLGIAYSQHYINFNRALRWVGVEWVFLDGPRSVIFWNWLIVLLLFAFMLGVERRGLRSIALQPPSGQDVQWALTFWGISFGLSGLLNALRPPPPSDGLGTLLQLSLPVLVLLVLTTATTEEICFVATPSSVCVS